MKQIDFEKVKRESLRKSLELLQDMLPGGILLGSEYTAGDLSGGKGKSFKFNIYTGLWADFENGAKGSDVTSLYAAANNVTQSEAVVQVAKMINIDPYLPGTEEAPTPAPVPVPAPAPTNNLPSMYVKSLGGKPSATWDYHDAKGSLVCMIARYDPPGGKEFLPWSKIDGEWRCKGLPAPRPLYKLPELLAHGAEWVCIVEGEKTADAARKILPEELYAVTTWPNGSKAWKKADWKPVYGKNILIVPDNDDAGKKTGQLIAQELSQHCLEIKVVDPSDMPDKWDIADKEMSYDEFMGWARSRIVSLKKDVPVEPETSSEVVPLDDDNIEGKSAYALELKVGLSINSNGNPDSNIDNCLRVFRGLVKYEAFVWYDEFHNKFMTNLSHFHEKSEKVREWQDKDDRRVRSFMQGQMRLIKIMDNMVHIAVKTYAEDYLKNEPRDWMQSLKWDGVKRIDSFLVDCFGVTNTDYTRAVSKNFWISVAARIYQPGCQVDNMLVLEGVQGTGKTTALRILGGDWHCEAQENITSNNFFQALHGKLIVEVSELSSFPRQEVQRIKQVISCKTDRYRAPYEKAPSDHPRMSVFVATTNEDKYLHDNTGARRFWPVYCHDINKELIAKNREQFYAEAVARFKDGETWYETPHVQTKDEQEARRQHDEWEYVVHQWLLHKNEVLVCEIAVECLKIDIAKVDMKTQRRLSGILHSLGWQVKTVMRSGHAVKVWCKSGFVPESTESMLPAQEEIEW